MKLALVSDIHGTLPALEAVVADIRRRGVDRIINLGDCLSGPLLPRETAQYLMAEGWPTLAGNHERQVLTDLRRGASDEYAHAQLTENEFGWMRKLPQTVRLAPEVFLCHGSPRSDCEYFLETTADGIVRAATPSEIDTRLAGEASPLIACGHTHVPRSVRTRRGQLIVNPGSVGLQAYDDDRPFYHVIENR